MVKGAITAKQVKKVHVLKSLLDVKEETYRQMLKNYGVTISKDLTFHQADELIRVFEHFAVKGGVWSTQGYEDKYEKLSSRVDFATPAQLRMVEGIWAELYPESQRSRDAALRTYLFRFFKVSDLRFLDAETVNKVLHALKQMKARKIAKKAPGGLVGPETDQPHGHGRKSGN